MGNKLKLYAIWNVAKSEFIKWITNPRIIIAGVLIMFIRSFAVLPMLEQSEKYGEPLNVMEPFIAAGNSGMLALFLPLVFLLLISDFPIMGGNTIFFINRTGKLNWFLGQIVFIIISIFVYIGTILLSCMVMSKGTFSAEWSNAITKFNAAFPDEAGGFVSKLIPSNLYNQIPILNAVIGTVLLIAMYLLTLALLLCLMKMLYLRGAGLLSALTVIVLGAASCSLKINVMWIFPTANTLMWLHYKEILKEPITPVENSFLYFLILIAVLFTANLFVLRNLQFINIEQDGM
ncbi:MAG: hypothetical protein HFK00_01305 [Oscillospiraceae bacterium]|nr:hypothetical protein [Oscillospiraceae bacterium]